MAKEITGLHSILGKLIFNLKDLSFSLEEFEKDKHEKKINEKLHYFRKKIKNREEEINELKMYDTQEYDKGVSKRNINALLMFVFGFIALVLQILNLAI
ncbi:MAG: hypothetical protein CVT92_17145 [Bacteroidetes bacterium HGW-Bacteroidetes-1]|nr:MAG: hypothetical protein CVT92_17145 [Bacteroidetes bacterium HGW-Bacteroidetes-1]